MMKARNAEREEAEAVNKAKRQRTTSSSGVAAEATSDDSAVSTALPTFGSIPDGQSTDDVAASEEALVEAAKRASEEALVDQLGGMFANALA